MSGKLYNTNLMPFDRATQSYWSQMRLDCVNGRLLGSKISTFDIMETTWATWKKAYPNSQILNTDTGFNRNYDDFPYDDYRTNNSNIIFPVGINDNRLLAKERVLGLVEGETKRVYSIESFTGGKVIEDVIDGNEIVVIGSKEDNFIVAFEDIGFTNLSYVADRLPVIAEDESGIRVTLFGVIDGGPLEGTQLKVQKSFMGYFFSFGAFYENIEIYE